MREKWEKYLGEKVYVETESYLQTKYQKVEDADCIVIPSVLIPDYNIAKAIKSLESGRLVKDGFVLASAGQCESSSVEVEYSGKVFVLKALTDIFSLNGMEIRINKVLVLNPVKLAAQRNQTTKNQIKH